MPGGVRVCSRGRRAISRRKCEDGCDWNLGPLETLRIGAVVSGSMVRGDDMLEAKEGRSRVARWGLCVSLATEGAFVFRPVCGEKYRTEQKTRRFGLEED